MPMPRVKVIDQNEYLNSITIKISCQIRESRHIIFFIEELDSKVSETIIFKPHEQGILSFTYNIELGKKVCENVSGQFFF